MMDDFGEILKSWENRRKQERKGAKEKMKKLLDRYAPDDAVIDLKQNKGAPSTDVPVHPAKLQIEDSIDLHGYTIEEASTRLLAFLRDSHAAGRRKILIIHGKGNHSKNGPGLGPMVRGMLEKCSFTGTFSYAGQKNGGRGATWVVLRQRSR